MYTYVYNRYDDNIQSLPWSLIIGAVYDDGVVSTPHWSSHAWSVIIISTTDHNHNHDKLTCRGSMILIVCNVTAIGRVQNNNLTKHIFWRKTPSVRACWNLYMEIVWSSGCSFDKLKAKSTGKLSSIKYYYVQIITCVHVNFTMFWQNVIWYCNRYSSCYIV